MSNQTIEEIKAIIEEHWRDKRQSSFLTNNDNVIVWAEARPTVLIRNRAFVHNADSSAKNPLEKVELADIGVFDVKTEWLTTLRHMDFAHMDKAMLAAWIQDIMQYRANPATDELIFKKIIDHVKEKGYETSQAQNSLQETINTAYATFKQRAKSALMTPCLMMTAKTYQELRLNDKFYNLIQDQQAYQDAATPIVPIVPVFTVNEDYLQPYKAIIIDKNVIAWANHVDVQFNSKSEHCFEQELDIALTHDVFLVNGLDVAIQAVTD